MIISRLQKRLKDQQNRNRILEKEAVAQMKKTQNYHVLKDKYKSLKVSYDQVLNQLETLEMKRRADKEKMIKMEAKNRQLERELRQRRISSERLALAAVQNTQKKPTYKIPKKEKIIMKKPQASTPTSHSKKSAQKDWATKKMKQLIHMNHELKMSQNLSPAPLSRQTPRNQESNRSSSLETTQNTEAKQKHHLNFSVVNLPESSQRETPRQHKELKIVDNKYKFSHRGTKKGSISMR